MKKISKLLLVSILFLSSCSNSSAPYIGENGNWWVGSSDLGVPATGPKGDKGEPGLNGSTGPKGDNGLDGQNGSDGKDGSQGEVGPKGDQGEVGPKGDKGDKGDEPYVGENGNWWIGDTDLGIFADYNYETRPISDGLIFTPMSVNGKTGMVVSDYDESLLFTSEEKQLMTSEPQTYLPIYGNLVIPDYVGNIPVIGIAKEVFRNNDYIYNVSLSKNTVYLASRSFYDCNNLTNIDFNGSKLNEIESEVFRYTNIQTITIPESVRKIGDYAFADSPLMSINYENVTHFGNYAFDDAYFEYVYLTNEVTYVGSYAFGKSFVYLEADTYPENWEANISSTLYEKYIVSLNCKKNDEYIYSINDNSLTIYKYLGNEERLTLPSTIENVPLRKIGFGFNSLPSDGISRDATFFMEKPYKDLYSGLELCQKLQLLQEVVIPDGVSEIDYGAFFSCYSIIYIPSSVEFVGLFAGYLSGCHLIFESSQYPMVGYSPDRGYDSTEEFQGDDGISTALAIDWDDVSYDPETKSYYLSDIFGYSLLATFGFLNEDNKFIIKSTFNNKTVHTIRSQSIYYIPKMFNKIIEIEDGINKIQRQGFYNSSFLAVIIPDSVLVINAYGFNDVCDVYYYEGSIIPSEWDSLWAGSDTSRVNIKYNYDFNNPLTISENKEYLYYELSDGTVKIITYLMDVQATTYVPRTIDNKIVSEIDSNAYYYSNSSRWYIYIPNNITKVNKYGFYSYRGYYAYVYFEASSKPTGFDGSYINTSTYEYFNSTLNY